MKKKPKLILSKRIDVRALRKLYRALTGRKP